MQKYLLGLDAGNTVIKAVIFNLAGREVAHAGEEGHSRMPCPGHVERDLGELWANAKRVIRTCLDKAGIAAGDIAAIGCAGHGNGLYALDRDGEPLIGIQSSRSGWRKAWAIAPIPSPASAPGRPRRRRCLPG
jgi:L-xylulokinase